MATATTVGANSSTAGVLEEADDLDVFRVVLSQSGELRIGTTGSTDTFGSLLNSGGTLLESDDDDGFGVNFLIELTLSAGTYFITVAGYDASVTGPYTLNLTFTSTGGGVNPVHSGAWYNQDQDGHGLNVIVLNGNRTIIYWYVYHTDGTPMFLTIDGTNDGNSTTGTAYYSAGMKFGEFNPNDHELTVWGMSTVTFHDCNNLTFEYSSDDPAYGSGSIPMTKLANVSGLECSNSQ